jgi:hypothetical protein
MSRKIQKNQEDIMSNGNGAKSSGSFEIKFKTEKQYNTFGIRFAQCYANLEVKGTMDTPRIKGDKTYEVDFKLECGCDNVLKNFKIAYDKTFKSTETDITLGTDEEADYIATLTQCKVRRLEASAQEDGIALAKALLDAQKTVTIQIAPDDLKDLKVANYKLCFAKKVGDADYNVVWQSFDRYLINNVFSWTPQYQLFGNNLFQDKILVQASTNQVVIQLGQTSILDNNGYLNPPKTTGKPTTLTMKNDYGSIHPGVNQISTNNINGKLESTPIYVAVKEAMKGEIELTPVDRVLVWFEQNVETSTMFSKAKSDAVEIDLTNDNSATRKYEKQTWITP